MGPMVRAVIQEFLEARWRGLSEPRKGATKLWMLDPYGLLVTPSRWRSSPPRRMFQMMSQATQSKMKAIALDRFSGLETMKLQTLPVPEVGPE